MIKYATLIFTLLMNFSAFAHDPIVPWPLEANRQDIERNDIEGTWSTSNPSMIRCVRFMASKEKADTVMISIYPQDESRGVQWGLAYESDRAYSGQVENQHHQSTTISVYRFEQSLFLRMQTKGSKYRDFELRRSYQCR